MPEDNININEEQKPETQETKTYTQEEVNELLQREGDRRVTQAEKKWEKKLATQKTLSELDADQREVAEKDMRIKELEEALAEHKAIQLKGEVLKVLSARELDAGLVDLIAIGEDIEEAQMNIEKLDKIINKEVTKRVKDKLGTLGGTPASATIPSGEMNKEAFNKLSIVEQQRMFDADPDFVRNLLR